MNQSIYQELIAAGCKIDSRESDLYVKVTSVSRPIVERHCWIEKTHKCNLFRSQTDNALWWEIPFAYEPFWEQASAEFMRIAQRVADNQPQ
jgi:hypothetical protein